MLRILKGKNFRQILLKYWKLLVIPPGSTALAILLSWAGVLQGLELKMLDAFFQLRQLHPLEALEPPDARIVIVTIDDEDISEVGAWPIPDDDLARVLNILVKQKPRAIGLDLYRDVPVEPGREQLRAVFRHNPNLIGVEKRFGLLRVSAPPDLPRSQVAFSDIVEDADQTVRRGLLTAQGKKRLYNSLAVKLASTYLEASGAEGRQLDSRKIKGGQEQFTAFSQSDGGYVRADDLGYQILINFRSRGESFQTISFRDVLRGKIPARLVHDRIVVIGSIAESIKDDFITPTRYVIKARNEDTAKIKNAKLLDRTLERSGRIRTPGVFVHANLTSQILSVVLDGRASIRVLPDALEWMWTLMWASLGVCGVWRLLQSINRFNGQIFYIRIVLGISVTGVGVFVSHGILFIGLSLWVPVVAPLMGLVIATILSANLYSGELFNFAYLDGLTQVANRRYFEQVLTRYARARGNLSLILCDVDFFKKYNDTYGHQAGDACLQYVAAAICQAVRQTDIVARYGGEEFVIILPRTAGEDALKVAERIVRQVRGLKLPHASSLISDYVTLSCGVCTISIDEQLLQDISWAPSHLVTKADKALYSAKEGGRNRAIAAQPGC